MTVCHLKPESFTCMADIVLEFMDKFYAPIMIFVAHLRVKSQIRNFK